MQQRIMFSLFHIIRNRWAAASCAWVLLGCTVCAEDPKNLESYVDGAVSALMTEKAVPGVAVSIVLNGEIALSKGYGYADLENESPVDPSHTLFRIASITKTFTWIAVMQLVEEGKLDLHEDINVYLNDMHVPAWNGEPLTLYDIMGHRAGFEDVTAPIFATSPEKAAAFEQWLKDNLPRRVRTPGEAFAYSNYATTLAGLIIENVSGVSYRDYVTQGIFTPAGMTRTRLDEPGAAEDILKQGYSSGYVLRNGKRVDYGFEYISAIEPAGSAAATADDMARYIRAFLKNGADGAPRLLSDEAMTQLRKRSYDDHLSAYGFSHGFLNGSYKGHEFWSHSGLSTTFASTMLVVPELEFGVFISVNQNSGAGPAVALPFLLLDYLYPAPSPIPSPFPPAGFASRSSDYLGVFMPTRRPYSTIEKFDFLIAGDFLNRSLLKVTGDDTGHLYLHNRGNITAWAETAPQTFRNVVSGDVMMFSTDTAGRIVGLNDARGYNGYDKLHFHQRPLFAYLAAFLAAAAGSLVLLGAVLSRTARSWLAVTAAAGIVLTAALFWSAVQGSLGPAPAAGAGFVAMAANLLVLPLVLLAGGTVMCIAKARATLVTSVLNAFLVTAGALMLFAFSQWNLLGLTG